MTEKLIEFAENVYNKKSESSSRVEVVESTLQENDDRSKNLITQFDKLERSLREKKNVLKQSLSSHTGLYFQATLTQLGERRNHETRKHRQEKNQVKQNENNLQKIHNNIVTTAAELDELRKQRTISAGKLEVMARLNIQKQQILGQLEQTFTVKDTTESSLVNDKEQYSKSFFNVKEKGADFRSSIDDLKKVLKKIQEHGEDIEKRKKVLTNNILVSSDLFVKNEENIKEMKINGVKETKAVWVRKEEQLTKHNEDQMGHKDTMKKELKAIEDLAMKNLQEVEKKRSGLESVRKQAKMLGSQVNERKTSSATVTQRRVQLEKMLEDLQNEGSELEEMIRKERNSIDEKKFSNRKEIEKINSEFAETEKMISVSNSLKKELKNIKIEGSHIHDLVDEWQNKLAEFESFELDMSGITSLEHLMETDEDLMELQGLNQEEQKGQLNMEQKWAEIVVYIEQDMDRLASQLKVTMEKELSEKHEEFMDEMKERAKKMHERKKKETPAVRKVVPPESVFSKTEDDGIFDSFLKTPNNSGLNRKKKKKKKKKKAFPKPVPEKVAKKKDSTSDDFLDDLFKDDDFLNSDGDDLNGMFGTPMSSDKKKNLEKSPESVNVNRRLFPTPKFLSDSKKNTPITKISQEDVLEIIDSIPDDDEEEEMETKKKKKKGKKDKRGKKKKKKNSRKRKRKDTTTKKRKKRKKQKPEEKKKTSLGGSQSDVDLSIFDF